MTIRAKPKKPQPPTSSDDGVGSVVLKGFTIPSGFVLHYTTNTGADKSAREGEFVNSSHKFQEVRDGRIPGWALQKVQSDFTFEDEEEETTVQFEDHTFTPWGDKATVLGVPVISQPILRKLNTVKKLGGIRAKHLHPEIVEYVSEIRNFLENTYKVKAGLSEDEVLEMMEVVNSNINLLLTLEKTAYIKKLFDINNPPDVTNPALDEQLNPKNSEKVNLDNLSPELLKMVCANSGISSEEFVAEVSSGITRAVFEEKYGQYLKVNSVKIDNILYTKDEARSMIEESLSGIPEEVRPVVVTYLGGEDLINQSVDEVIASLKEADYFFTETMSSQELDSLSPKDELTLYDLRKIRVEGYDLIPGRFEILKRILSIKMLSTLLTEGSSQDDSNQSVQDTVSEIIENYIEYLGGEIHAYKSLMTDWLVGKQSNYTKTFMDWVDGKNTPEVKTLRPTFSAIQSAHSDIYDTVTEGIIHRPLIVDLGKDVFNITEISVEVLSPLISFTLDRELVEQFIDRQPERDTTVVLTSKVTPSKVMFIPGLYMPKPYWKKVKGKPVHVNRTSVDRDENAEVVVKSTGIIIKKSLNKNDESYKELEVVI